MSDFPDEKEKLKQDLIQRIGLWGFPSYRREYWPKLSDEEIVSCALLRAPRDIKILLLSVYNIDFIKKVWLDQVLIQDKWFHEVNIWVAENIYKAEHPRSFVAS